MDVELREHPAALRCALCHDSLARSAPGCGECATRWHIECRVEHGRCPTLGCRASLPPAGALGADEVERRERHDGTLLRVGLGVGAGGGALLGLALGLHPTGQAIPVLGSLVYGGMLGAVLGPPLAFLGGEILRR